MLITKCAACEARESHITDLKLEIESLRIERDELNMKLSQIIDKQIEMNQHFVGMNRAQQKPASEMHSIQRSNNSIAGRIARAEKESHDDVLIARRKNEYEARVANLMNPEIVVQDDAIQEGSTK